MQRYFPGGRVISEVLAKTNVRSFLKKSMTFVPLRMIEEGVDLLQAFCGADESV